MSNIFDKVEGIAKRTATVFFIIDQSGSMDGVKIGAVNHAMGEVGTELKKLMEDNADANLELAVLTFSQSAQWMTSEPISVENFHWENIDSQSMTNFGLALEELNARLSKDKKGFMKGAKESYAPAFILLSDGMPTDNYKVALSKIQGNGWFKYGIKTAVAIGDDADKKRLAEFTGTMENVIEVHNSKDLIKVIKFLSITSSCIATKGASGISKTTDDDEPIVITQPDDLLGDDYSEF